MGARIRGYGIALPDKIVTNHDLAASGIDTTHEWIMERTGISERRVGPGTAELSIQAGRQILERSGLAPEDIDLLILATTSPDQQCPATASHVQAELGLSCGAFDMNAACSGFVYGLIAAHGFIGQGAERIMVIGAESLSRITDWTDRGTCILFADGAGGVIVEKTDGPGELLGWHLDSDGTARHVLYADIGGYLIMDGKEVFRRAVRAMVNAAEKALDNAGLTVDDIDVVIPHQANVRILESAMRKLGLSMDICSQVLEHTGNTSSATIPLAMHHALETDMIEDGNIVLLVGFGAGMTSASAVLRWGA